MPIDEEGKPGGSVPQNNESQVARVSVKIPPIWRKNVKVWFMQVEAQFATAGITAEITRFNHVLGTLEADVAELVSDFLAKPLSTTPFTDFKRRLIHEFEESEGRKVNKLLTELELGDKKPSQLLREMRNLAGTQVQDDFLRTIFIQRLPVTARSILASSSDNLDNLATMADKIIEFSGPTQNVYCTQNELPGRPERTTTTTPQTDRISRLEAQIAELTTAIREMRTRSESRPRRSRSRSNTPSRYHPKGSFCWYHFKFGDKAKKCEEPCSYQPKFADSSKHTEN